MSRKIENLREASNKQTNKKQQQQKHAKKMLNLESQN